MSLIRTAIRIALVRALLNATPAEDRVFDSRIAEIDQAAVEGRKPFIVVTTDDQEGEVEGRGLLSSDQILDVVIETAIATRIVLSEDEDEGEIVIPDTDAGYELALDIICRRITRTVQFGGGEWGDIFRELVPAFTNMIVRRGADTRSGTKFAARQIVISCRPIFDPIEPPAEGTPLDRLLTKMDTVAALAGFAAAIRNEIENGPNDWRIIQRANGWTDAATGMLGETEPEEGEEEPGLDLDDEPATGGEAALPPEEEEP